MRRSVVWEYVGAHLKPLSVAYVSILVQGDRMNSRGRMHLFARCADSWRAAWPRERRTVARSQRIVAGRRDQAHRGARDQRRDQHRRRRDGRRSCSSARSRSSGTEAERGLRSRTEVEGDTLVIGRAQPRIASASASSATERAAHRLRRYACRRRGARAAHGERPHRDARRRRRDARDDGERPRRTSRPPARAR